MTPDETIRDAWAHVPTDWPGRREGNPYRIVAWEPIQSLVNLLPEEPVPFYPVEFSWERGRIEGQPVWRVIGRWRDTEIEVGHGPI